jgi:hypothetical protein
MMATTLARRKATLRPTMFALLVAMMVAAVVVGLFAARAAHADTTFTVNTTEDENDLGTSLAGHSTAPPSAGVMWMVLPAGARVP